MTKTMLLILAVMLLIKYPPADAAEKLINLPSSLAELDLSELKNKHYSDKAALLDPDSQFYTRSFFSLSVPAGETWYIFNAWRVGINGSDIDFYHRPIGVEEALMVGGGTVLSGLDQSSYIWYARPSIVNGDERYKKAEKLYYERIEKLKRFETKALHVGREPNTLAGGDARFPSTVNKAVIIHTFTHGGCFTILDGGSGEPGNKERVTNIDIEINDGYEFRTTNTVLQPFRRSMFDGVFLGAGNAENNRSMGPNGTYTGPVPHFEETSGGVMYVEIPDDGSW